MKSEPDEASIDDLFNAPHQTLAWTGVRNYQARNYMRDAMHIGDLVFFYHSSCAQPGIAGIAQVCSNAYPDDTQFDPRSPYFDPTALPENPRWLMVDVHFVKKTTFLPLSELRKYPELEGMLLLKKGNRLSITPISKAHWQFITQQLLHTSF